jgi:hypothetical protein
VTSRLVEHAALLSDKEWVHIKGSDDPVPARRLLAIAPRDGRSGERKRAWSVGAGRWLLSTPSSSVPSADVAAS